MPLQPLATTMSLSTLPLAMLRIGLWEDNVSIDRIRGDAVMASMYGLTETEAEQGLSWANLSSRFHPDDLQSEPSRHRHVRENGGLFVWEHRILPAPGVARWVLARGHFERDTNGQMCGRGIIIDVTGTRIDGHVDGPSRFLASHGSSESVLDCIASQAMEIFNMVRSLDGAGQLRPLMEAFLYEVGQQLAKSLQNERTALERPPSSKIH